jgi:hypothetical protein
MHTLFCYTVQVLLLRRIWLAEQMIMLTIEIFLLISDFHFNQVGMVVPWNLGMLVHGDRWQRVRVLDLFGL